MHITYTHTCFFIREKPEMDDIEIKKADCEGKIFKYLKNNWKTSTSLNT